VGLKPGCVYSIFYSLSVLTTQYLRILAMTSGKGDGFQGKQRKWLQQRTAAYLAKTAYGKATDHIKPLPSDDNDLSDWVKAQLQEFETTFKDELEDMVSEEGMTMQKLREVCGNFCILLFTTLFMCGIAIQSMVSQSEKPCQNFMEQEGRTHHYSWHCIYIALLITVAPKCCTSNCHKCKAVVVCSASRQKDDWAGLV
jgi:hypothetical protein